MLGLATQRHLDYYWIDLNDEFTRNYELKTATLEIGANVGLEDPYPKSHKIHTFQ